MLLIALSLLLGISLGQTGGHGLAIRGLANMGLGDGVRDPARVRDSHPNLRVLHSLQLHVVISRVKIFHSTLKVAIMREITESCAKMEKK